MRHDPTFWLLARASGVLAYVAVTASVLAGLLVKARPFRTLRPATVTDLHRLLALVGLGAVALHGAALVLDRTVEVTPVALVVPGLVDYRPLPTALGVVAGDLALLLVVSFRLRRRIGLPAWRRLHRCAYVVFVAATVHGLGAGTDAGRPWAMALHVGAVAAVAAATTWRVLVPPPRPTRPPIRPPGRPAHPSTDPTTQGAPS